MSALAITEERFEELVRGEVARVIAEERPRVIAEIAKSCEVIDEAAGIAMLPIKGKDPRRTFRRLMNRYGVEKVVLGPLKGWKRSAVQKLIDDHTVRSRSSGLRIAERKAA